MIRVDDKLGPYRRKRHFRETPEPSGEPAAARTDSRFVIQKHDARTLHYDLRLEAEGVLKSWAVPKGPSLDPADKRLAIRTEDHPLEYADFEGVIPEGEYGAGAMIVWDAGTYRSLRTDKAGRELPLARMIEGGSVKIWLEGKKVRGGYTLVRSKSRSRQSDKEQWLLIKLRDEQVSTNGDVNHLPPASVLTERTVEDLAAKPSKAASAGVSGGVSGGGGVAKTPQPQWIDPMLATLAHEPVSGADWVFEAKLDGIRALAFRSGDEVRLYSRNRKLLNGRYPEIVEALRKQPIDDFIIDGELLAFEKGRSGFAQIQKRMGQVTLDQASRHPVQVFCYVFDLLHANGYDARPLPLRQRRALLEQAIEFQDPIRASEVIAANGDGRGVLDEACAQGLEGVIAKLGESPYVSGRSRSWLKLKCSNQQEFVIGGWTDPRGSRKRFGALLVGYYGNGKLRYAGKVGTGFDEDLLDSIFAELEKLARKTSPFDDDVPVRNPHWVKPALVAQIAFGEWTRDGRLRHPRFLGLRMDKDPRAVVRERAVEAEEACGSGREAVES